MRETILGNHLQKIPSIAVGCMRLSEKSKEEMNHFIHSALEQGAYFFDHADIYGGGMSETVFGDLDCHLLANEKKGSIERVLRFFPRWRLFDT